MAPVQQLPFEAMRKDGRPLVTITQAAVQCGVSRRTIYNWLSTGSIESVRAAGGSIRIYRDTLFREHP